MIGFIIGTVGCLVGLIGWFAFDSIALLIVGSVLYVIERFMEIAQSNANSYMMDIVIFAIGCLFTTPFYIGGMIALNCYSALISVITIPYMIKMYKELLPLIILDNLFTNRRK